MNSKLTTFKTDAAAAIADANEADTQVVERLKRMSPEEFARAPRELIEDLSTEQYRDVLAQVTRMMDSEDEPPRKASAWKHLIRHVPAALLVLAKAGLLGVAVFLLVLAGPPTADWWWSRTPPVRTFDTGTWPSCGRLTAWDDGCVYTVTNNLTWNAAASLLELPSTYLRQVNRHITTETLPAGAVLVVWRERGTLRNLP
jgi:hypothetical protein